ncbi:MAG: HIT family protein [Actinomycetota bacterium]
MSTDRGRVPFDVDSYGELVQSRSCFICRIVSDPAGEEIVSRDEHHIAFLPRFHVQLGYVLVAPVAHREGVVDDFELDEYLGLQRLVHRVGRAVSSAVATERVYVASLGSQQANAHVHWHVVALPPGVPLDQQQFRAMMPEANGVLDLDPRERADFAERVRRRLADDGSS